jgi:hypothetical protein
MFSEMPDQSRQKHLLMSKLRSWQCCSKDVSLHVLSRLSVVATSALGVFDQGHPFYQQWTCHP